jgi:hypothetical protein
VMMDVLYLYFFFILYYNNLHLTIETAKQRSDEVAKQSLGRL